MRDIKFKGVHPDTGDVMDVCLIDWSHNEVIFNQDSDGSYPIEQCKLMQFTGMKDKNGVDIYEGYIVRHWRQGNRAVMYPASENYAGFGVVNGSGMRNTLNDGDNLYEVIGNIHETPELLEC